jgi:4-diphosphocytidyl-2-C-methyl-D-erythritol kinase
LLTIKASAKINLTLEVLYKRPDGFHEIRSVLQTIDLYDTLHLEVTHGVYYKCNSPEWSAKQSLVDKAVSLLQNTTRCSKGVTVTLEKRIPLMAGLGGDSSDSAALLRGLNKLWELNLTHEKLAELAARLGSDVTYFLYGGTALVKGRGEIVTPLPSLPKMSVVIVIPDVTVQTGKTAQMYAALKANNYTDGSTTDKLVNSLHNNIMINPSMLFNTFENIVLNGQNAHTACAEQMIKLGAPRVHLAGSGPALFTLFFEQTRADSLYANCIAHGMRAYLTSTSFTP